MGFTTFQANLLTYSYKNNNLILPFILKQPEMHFPVYRKFRAHTRFQYIYIRLSSPEKGFEVAKNTVVESSANWI